MIEQKKELGEIISKDGDLLELSYNAVEHFGIGNQLGIMQEECAELIQAISKIKREIGHRENLLEELADVFIVWHQIAMSFGVKDIETKIVEKMIRLHSIIKN
jgi:NTP pyrophosphatase (non-canonical NTP hydrolase)